MEEKDGRRTCPPPLIYLHESQSLGVWGKTRWAYSASGTSLFFGTVPGMHQVVGRVEDEKRDLSPCPHFSARTEKQRTQ